MSPRPSDPAMEHPFCRVPYEDFRRGFRTGQKHVEREIAELKKGLSNGEDAERMIERVRELEGKLTNIHTETIAILHARIAHLHSGESGDTQLTRWLVDWALRTGKERTARALVDASSSSLASLVDLPLFTLVSSILTSLRAYDCAPALAFAKRQRLPQLEFELRLQEFVELCRVGNATDAVAYSRRWLAGFYDDSDAKARIEKTMALIAFPPAAAMRIPAYKRLYAPERWTALEALVNKAVYEMYGLPHEPVLWLAMYAGLVALKHGEGDQPEQEEAMDDGAASGSAVEWNVDCPVCPPPPPSAVDEKYHDGEPMDVGGQTLSALASCVPSSHHPHSVIVCRISGEITHDPMAFPNGYVYSRSALMEMADRNGGRVRCPRSGLECSWDELRKVFIS